MAPRKHGDAPARSMWRLMAALPLLLLPRVVYAQHETPPPPAAYALKGVTVVGADGVKREGVNVVVRHGLIEALGPGVAIPRDAKVLEGDSLWVYPGLVDADAGVELEFPEGGDGGGAPSWDLPREAQGFTPHRRAAEHLGAGGDDLRASRRAGVVAGGVHPGGGMAAGLSAALLFRKETRSSQELVLEPEVGLSFSFQGARGGYPSSLFAVIAAFRQWFEDASHYRLLKSEFSRDARGLTEPGWDPDLEVLGRAAAGELPVFFRANDDEEIRRVLKLAEEIGFRPIIVGGEEAWQLAPTLAGKGIPVLVSVAFPEPREWKPEEAGEGGTAEVPEEAVLEPGAAREKERLENAYANAGRLVEAGVTVALTSGRGEGELLDGARKAIEYGLPEDEALRALTAAPAQILGIPSVPRVEAGFAANLLVTDGPLFEEGTRVRYTFVDGALESGAEAAGGGGEAPAVDVSGTWDVTVAAQGMELQFTMSLTQEGSSFSGTMSSAETGEARIEGGRVSGNSLSFTLVFSMGTESMEVPARATVAGDQINGSGSAEMGTFTFTGTRRPGMRGGLR